ncbi:MAG: YceI family protein [Chitinophagaceae bacterium]
MKKILLLICFITAFLFKSYSQLYMTRTGFIGFYSKTPLEDIKAENQQVYAVIDASKKNIAFTLLIKSFVFTKELMQEHFNENYAESDKFPKASFNGSYTGNVDLSKDGLYNITANGNLTFHGVTKNITEPATLEVKQGRLLGHSHFQLKPEDFNISIPSLVREKIASEMDVEVKIDCTVKQ